MPNSALFHVGIKLKSFISEDLLSILIYFGVLFYENVFLVFQDVINLIICDTFVSVVVIQLVKPVKSVYFIKIYIKSLLQRFKAPSKKLHIHAKNNIGKYKISQRLPQFKTFHQKNAIL